ncbi:hypothetical protein [Daejeonella sp.]|uniref:hypothetical protein n=1 Tax=Daejeonella sp. TaxID=2805397 RepID=UPI003983BAB0
MKTHRLFMYAADLMIISGKSERTCRRLLQNMKDHFGLEKRQQITFHQVAEFLCIPVDQILPYIRMLPFVVMDSTP